MIIKIKVLLTISVVVSAIVCGSHAVSAQTGGTVVPPKVGGRAFQPPNSPAPKMSKEEFETFVKANLTKTLSPPPKDTPPAANRSRGESARAAGCGGAGFKGRCDIFQFTNDDFKSTDNTCAQAAMATALWTVGLTFNNDQKGLAQKVYAFAPPKITLGNIIQWKEGLGTDWRQVNAGLDKFVGWGIKYTWVDGEPEIKKYLAMNLPVLIMLDTGTLPQFNYQWWTGHWVTAFGYDQNYIYVSNFPNNKMTWAQLDAAFRKGTLAVGHGTSGRAAVVWK